MVKLGFALPFVCGTLPIALSFSAQVKSYSGLHHPSFPDRMLEKSNAGGNGGATSTKAGGDLINELSADHDFTPTERMILTSGGNLQTNLSSYYLQVVELESKMRPSKNQNSDDDDKIPLCVFDRDVSVKVGGEDAFKAKSIVKVYDEALFDAYTSQQVGLDQLLKMFKIRPRFTLHDAGRKDDGSIWRFYTLEDHNEKVDFEILEEFEDNVFDLPILYDRRVKSQVAHPNFPNRMLTKANDEPNAVVLSRNDLTSTNAGGNLIHYLSDTHELTPIERIAITSNGSLQMAFSSYYLQATDVQVTRNEAIDQAEDDDSNPTVVFDREVMQYIGDRKEGNLFCKANSIVKVYSQEIADIFQSVGIGNLLRQKDLNPEFILHDAGRAEDGGLWRFYSMNCKGIIEFDILEEFPENVWDLPCMPK